MKRWMAVAAGVLVTLLWSTSYILNVYAFREGIGPITLAGLRYAVAVCVLGLVIRLIGKKGTSHAPEASARKPSLKLRHYLLLGGTGFMMAQGLQYAGQPMVSPTQTSLVLNIGNSLMVLLVDALWLRESQNRRAYAGIVGVAAGALLFYYPWEVDGGSLLGILLILMSSVGYAVHLNATRAFLSGGLAEAHDLVLRPMAIGAAGMLAVGLAVEGMPSITWTTVGILLWLGSVNGALAFYLWAWSQKHLQAFESSVINNLMLVEITILDILVFSRDLTLLQALGLLTIGLTVAYMTGRKKSYDHTVSAKGAAD